MLSIKNSIITLLSAFLFLFSPHIHHGETKERGISLETLRLANPSANTMTFLPFDLGLKKGFYEREGIRIEILVMKTGLIEWGLNSGEIDFGGSAGIVRAAVLGLPVKLILAIADRPPHFLITRPEIRSVKELKGKTFAVGQVGSTMWGAAREILRRHGVDTKEISFVSTGPLMQLPALLAGSVDAALIPTPQNVLARSKGLNQILRVADFLELATVALSASVKKLKEKPSQVKRMIRATLKAMIYIGKEKAESVEFMVKEWQLEEDLARQHYDDSIKLFAKNGQASDAAILMHIDMARSAGVIKGEVPISKVVDFSLLKEVQKELGLSP